jgi:hypothetical protein
MQHQMIVIGHNGIRAHINGKDLAKQAHTLDNPNTAMLKALT